MASTNHLPNNLFQSGITVTNGVVTDSLVVNGVNITSGGGGGGSVTINTQTGVVPSTNFVPDYTVVANPILLGLSNFVSIGCISKLITVVTTNAHNIPDGASVTVSGFAPSLFNGVFNVSYVSPTSFTYNSLTTAVVTPSVVGYINYSGTTSGYTAANFDNSLTNVPSTSVTHTLQSEIDAINAELNKVNIPELAQQAIDIYEKVSSFGELETKVNNSDNVNVQDLVNYVKSVTGLSTLSAGVSVASATTAVAATIANNSNFLPKSGGTLTGPITLATGTTGTNITGDGTGLTLKNASTSTPGVVQLDTTLSTSTTKVPTSSVVSSIGSYSGSTATLGNTNTNLKGAITLGSDQDSSYQSTFNNGNINLGCSTNTLGATVNIGTATSIGQPTVSIGTSSTGLGTTTNIGTGTAPNQIYIGGSSGATVTIVGNTQLNSLPVATLVNNSGYSSAASASNDGSAPSVLAVKNAIIAATPAATTTVSGLVQLDASPLATQSTTLAPTSRALNTATVGGTNFGTTAGSSITVGSSARSINIQGSTVQINGVAYAPGSGAPPVATTSVSGTVTLDSVVSSSSSLVPTSSLVNSAIVNGTSIGTGASTVYLGAVGATATTYVATNGSTGAGIVKVGTNSSGVYVGDTTGTNSSTVLIGSTTGTGQSSITIGSGAVQNGTNGISIGSSSASVNIKGAAYPPVIPTATSSASGTVTLDSVVSTSSSLVPTSSLVNSAIVNGTSFGTGATGAITIGNSSQNTTIPKLSVNYINGLTTPFPTYPFVVGGCMSNETTTITSAATCSVVLPFSWTISSSAYPKFYFTTGPIISSGTLTFDIKNGTSSIYLTLPTWNETVAGQSPGYSFTGALNTNPTTFAAGTVLTVSIGGTFPTITSGGIGLKVLIYAS